MCSRYPFESTLELRQAIEALESAFQPLRCVVEVKSHASREVTLHIYKENGEHLLSVGNNSRAVTSSWTLLKLRVLSIRTRLEFRGVTMSPLHMSGSHWE